MRKNNNNQSGVHANGNQRQNLKLVNSYEQFF